MTQKWKFLNIFSISIVHIIALYSIYFTIKYSRNLFLNILWIIIVSILAGFGVTAGVHRLWCHKSYKAKTPFRIFLAFCYSIAGQNTIYDWVRDHRSHHKFSDTSADPHDASRGFWFSHVGWLLMDKHKDVIEKGKCIDMSDIIADPVVSFHTKYFIPLKILCCFVLPTVIPVYLWNEDWLVAILSQVFFRYVFTLNSTWLVNSAAHMWGNKPYNENILPSENKFVSFFSIGEGWHNYHHVFPYDYKASELGTSSLTTMFLDIAKQYGLIYDCKQPSQEYVEKIKNDKIKNDKEEEEINNKKEE